MQTQDPIQNIFLKLSAAAFGRVYSLHFVSSASEVNEMEAMAFAFQVCSVFLGPMKNRMIARNVQS